MSGDLEYNIKTFLERINPYGSLDLGAAIQTAMDAGKDGDWVADELEEWLDDVGGQMKDTDINYIVYDALLQEARGNIDSITGIDILNDTKERIEVYGNCMCTTLDYTEEAKAELLKIVKIISVEDRTDAINWLVKEVE